MDDTLKKLGTVRNQDEGRDAIHIAVITMQVLRDVIIFPGTYVDVNGNPRHSSDPDAIGIVDPFFSETRVSIKAGQWFYVYLKPGTTTGLTHVWTHPAFPDEEKTVIYELNPPPTREEAIEKAKELLEEEGYEVEKPETRYFQCDC